MSYRKPNTWRDIWRQYRIQTATELLRRNGFDVIESNVRQVAEKEEGK